MTQKATVMKPYVNKVYNFIILRKLKLKPKTFRNFKKDIIYKKYINHRSLSYIHTYLFPKREKLTSKYYKCNEKSITERKIQKSLTIKMKKINQKRSWS